MKWVTDGGETNLANLVLACPRHHHLWHSGDWELKLLPNAELHITGPDGRSYRIDTYVVALPAVATGTAGNPRAGARAQKQVTVVVRKADEDQRTLARLVTNFDQSTG